MRGQASERRKTIDQIPIGGKAFSGNLELNERGHFIKFKGLHKAGMSAAKIEKAHVTGNGGSSARGMQGVLHLPEKLPLWMRLREHLKRGWDPITVNNKIDSVTMPKWIASAILGTMLLFAATSWWRASDQRDMLIELKTELRLAKEYEAERSKELKAQAELNKVYIDNMTNQLNVIKGMLSAQQISAIEAAKRGNN